MGFAALTEGKVHVENQRKQHQASTNHHVNPGRWDPNIDPEVHAYKLNSVANAQENNAVRREMLEAELQECIKRSRAMWRRANYSGRPRSANAASWKGSRSTVDSANDDPMD